MKWELKETKKNPATGKTQEYKIIVETTKIDNVLKATVTVPACPRGQRPTSWHSKDVLNWLQQKGIAVDKPLSSKTLTDITSETKTFDFSLIKKTTTPTRTKTTRGRTKKTPTKPTTTTVQQNTPTADTE